MSDHPAVPRQLAAVSCTCGAVGIHLGFESPIAMGAILVEYSTVNRVITHKMDQRIESQAATTSALRGWPSNLTDTDQANTGAGCREEREQKGG